MTAPASFVDNSFAAPTNTDALLSSFTSWRPTHGFFSIENETQAGMPSTPFLLTPAVMDVLQSMRPVADARATS